MCDGVRIRPQMYPQSPARSIASISASVYMDRHNTLPSLTLVIMQFTNYGSKSEIAIYQQLTAKILFHGSNEMKLR